MHLVKRFISLFAVSALLINTQVLVAQAISGLRKTNRTVAEIDEWAKNQKRQKPQVWLLYQGSDSVKHHFISRVMDEWVWFKVGRNEIKLGDERVYRGENSHAPLGYYYVDPLDGYKKVKEYE